MTWQPSFAIVLWVAVVFGCAIYTHTPVLLILLVPLAIIHMVRYL